jgi:hypothetical protein
MLCWPECLCMAGFGSFLELFLILNSGLNYDGELGIYSSKFGAKKPQLVWGDDTWVAISTGLSHTCGLGTDNTVMCMGE